MASLREKRISLGEKVIWITGASSGIGAALAVQLSKLGARLILTSRDGEALAEVQSRCAGPVTLLPADLIAADVSLLAQNAIAIHGKIDILINNAGVGQRATAEETSEGVMRSIMELNFFAPVLLTQALLPHFRQHGGHVVVTGSMAGLMGVPRRTAYSAAKHAVMGYFESLQVEHDMPSFHVTIASPGRVRTQLSVNALRGGGELHGEMDKAQQQGIPAEVCARKMINAIVGKKRHVVIAREEQLLWWLRKWVPPLYYIAARRFGS